MRVAHPNVVLFHVRVGTLTEPLGPIAGITMRSLASLSL